MKTRNCAILVLASVACRVSVASEVDYRIAAPVSDMATDGASEVVEPQISEDPASVQEASTLSLSLTSTVDPVFDHPGWSASFEQRNFEAKRAGSLPMTEVRSGIWYFARVQLDPFQSVSQSSNFVSSRQLGVHYGRLGSVNYSSVDFGFEQVRDTANENNVEDQDLWSLGVTTGKRFSFTGLDSSDPVWTLSLRGRFNFEDSAQEELTVDNQTWYFSPGLHWERDSFKLSADVLMPLMQTGELEEDSDYSVRAQFIKKF